MTSPAAEPRQAISRSSIRIAWTIGDQGLSSLTNVAISIFVARSVAPGAFGAFGISFAVYLVVIGAARSLTTDPLMVRFPQDRSAVAAPAATGTALMLGVGFAAVIGLSALAFSGDLRACLLVLGLAIPGLLVQDAWRFVLIGAGRPEMAFLNDAVWLGLQVPLLIAIRNETSPAAFLAVWGLAALAAAAVGALQAKAPVHPRATLEWLRLNRELTSGYLAEFCISQSAAFFSTLAVASLAGLAAAGAYRGGQVITGPLNVLVVGGLAAAVAEAVRLRDTDTAALPRRMGQASGVIALFVVLLGVGLISIPSRAGVGVLGDTWAAAHRVLPPLVLVTAGNALLIGAIAGVRALERPAAAVRVRMITGMATLALSCGGAAIGSYMGAAIGMAIAVNLSALLWWHTFIRLTRMPVPNASATREPPEICGTQLLEDPKLGEVGVQEG